MINTEEMVVQTSPEAAPSPFKLGTVAALFANNTAQVLFDGETTASEKQYAYLSTYVPEVDDRVLLVNVGGTYIIMGDISYNIAPSPPVIPQNYLFDAEEVVMTQGLDVTGLLEAKSGVAVTGDLAVSGNGTVGGTLEVTGNTTIGGTLGVTAQSTFLDYPTFTKGMISSSGYYAVFNGGIKHVGTTLGFFNKTPATKGTNIPQLSSQATLATVISTVNSILTLLSRYGLH